MTYLKLFLVYFKIGLFNFGGGYAMISFIQNEIVYKNAWLTAAEFTDMIAISQVTPGPLGINMATYCGYTVSGDIFGAALATFALCLPSFLIMLFLSHLLIKHHDSKITSSVFSVLKPAVVGLIAAAALVLCTAENFHDWRGIIIFLIAFSALYFWKISPFKIIMAAAAMGLAFFR